jgi:hypothetical protein
MMLRMVANPPRAITAEEWEHEAKGAAQADGAVSAAFRQWIKL